MKLRRVLSCLMALLLVCSLPVSVLADTWYLEDGSITVNAAETGQTVSQGTQVDVLDDAPVITQKDSETATTNTVTINAAENATANVTIQDVNIVISDTGDHSGEAAVTITAEENAAANVTLNDVNIDVLETGDDQHRVPGEAAVQITGEGDVTIELDGENTVQSGHCRAGVEKNDGDSSGKLTITDENGTDGSLEATGGDYGSGIGGGNVGNGSDITITGSAEVTANGGMDAAGIGGGAGGSGSNITITGNAEVTAQGDDGGAGIGGGAWGSGSNITISGSAEVTAKGDIVGAGIGGGYNSNGKGTGSNITVSGDAQVKAQGGNSYYNGHITLGTGAAIGNGGHEEDGNNPVAAKGEDAVVTTDAPEEGKNYGLYVGELKEGWVATYTPGTTDLDTPTLNSLNYMDDNNTLQTATENIVEIGAKAPTCTEDGHRAGFMIGNTQVGGETLKATGHSMGEPYTYKEPTCQEEGVSRRDCANCDYYETTPIGIVDHSYGDYVSDDNATCTEDGTQTRTCIWCGLPDTIPDPGTMLRHQFTNYVSDGNATCTEDGTKTAECDHSCGETDTVTDEGSALDHSFTNYVSDGNATFTEDGTKTAQCDHEGCGETDTVTDEGSRLPFYLVKDEGGRRIPCQEQKQGSVLTITVDADFAILTGTLGGMRALKGQGVDTIVFVTNGATSTFAIEDLLAQGSAASTYMLTHDGETVTFTLGDGTDIGKILK